MEETLAALYSFNTTLMLADPHLTDRSVKLRSRLFNELVLSSVVEAQRPILEEVQVTSTATARRITVAATAAVPLSVLLFLLFCYLCYLSWVAAVQRRPLDLSTDPATTFGMAVYLQDHLAPWHSMLPTEHRLGLGESAARSSSSTPSAKNPREFGSMYFASLH
jgi:hypothetical protein